MGHQALGARCPQLDWQRTQSAFPTVEWQRQDPLRAGLWPSWADILGLQRQHAIGNVGAAQNGSTKHRVYLVMLVLQNCVERMLCFSCCLANALLHSAELV